ncbi:uncharacterized protein PAC_12461 [Phialocephala subalpina]|uniref:Copper acquisition factor BIM1-like domain-containing protein n=1 Tax=Phialocephala subalpina TaxID=576137 RepID=A0A1L7XC05_9HELO|nr:uncharacterized protein PAC_12461 [Phialocephala subalpina]
MQTPNLLAALAALLHLTTAHFLLISPPCGFSDDTIATFPFRGFYTVSANRTLFPISAGQIALEMADASADIEVLIGIGNNVGHGFNQVIRKTFRQSGEGDFCMTGFELDKSLNVMNATIQVITSNEDGADL